MKRFNYFHERRPITRKEFLLNVPDDWEENLVDDEYHYGYYKAVMIEDLDY